VDDEKPFNCLPMVVGGRHFVKGAKMTTFAAVYIRKCEKRQIWHNTSPLTAFYCKGG